MGSWWEGVVRMEKAASKTSGQQDESDYARRRPPIATLLVAALCIVATLSGLLTLLPPANAPVQQAGARGLDTPTKLLYAQNPCTPVYVYPNVHSTLITQLLGGTDVTALEQTQANGATWQHVRIWSGIDGYIPAGALIGKHPADASEGDCTYPGVPDPAVDILPASRGPFTLSAKATVHAPATLFRQADDRGLPLAGLPIGLALTVTAWASDAAGRPWYQVQSAAGDGWVWSGNVRVTMSNPAKQIVHGHPIWQPVAGKGMWFTNYLSRHSDPKTLMDAAKRAGITHVYAEVAITQYGFYARNSLDRLIPAAHANGITVISWVYPTLNNIAADVRMTKQVADYVTPSGDHADGIAADVEEMDDSARVYTYGQLIRALLGPDTLLVAAVYHPYAQAFYPYAAIAASWNVIAPMDYWHSRAHHSYSPDDVARFVGGSIMTIRAAMAALGTDAMLPIEELGQTYDMYSADFTGAADAPTAAEMNADMSTAHDLGCIGISFFEWQTATQDEWTAITNFRW